MIDDPDDRSRAIDLRPLAPDADESEIIIGAVMARLAGRPQLAAMPTDILVIVGNHVPRAWIATAAALMIAASLAVVWSSRGRPAPIDATIATWAIEQHVPTNGELLLAFQGYAR